MADEDHREILETKRLEIVKSLNCERSLMLNHLRSSHVFDQEDCELIGAEKTSDGKAGKLVDFLVKKGPEAYKEFLEVILVENAALYETLTGLDASSRPSTLVDRLCRLCPDPNSRETMITLADRQEQAYSELRNMSLRYTQLLKEKQVIEERLEKAEKDLEFERERREYEKRMAKELKNDEGLEENEVLFLNDFEEMRKGIADRDVYIIVLQMKLLAEKEECDALRSKVEEFEEKNESMARDLRRVSDNYHHERCQSLKLSQCIRLQVDEIQKMDEVKKRLRESQYQNILLREERDCRTEELTELKKWAEALKTRFDIIEKEKLDSQEKTEFVTNNCANLQESVRTLQRTLSLSKLEIGECKKRNDMLTHDCEIFKKQRDCALDARKEAIVDRDKAIAEKDALQQQYYELQTKRDKINEEKATLIRDYDAMERRYKTTLEELGRVKKKLNEKEMEAEDLGRLLSELEEKNRRNSRLLEIVPGLPEISPDESDEGSPSDTPAELTEEEEEGGKAPQARNPWRERRLKSLLRSMKTRISGERSDEDIAKVPVSPVSSNVTLQVLQCLLPNLSNRPYSSVDSVQISRTLQRQMGVRRLTGLRSASPKSQTLPCPVKLEDAEKPLETDESVQCAPTTFDKTYPPDVNTLPEYFRGRAKLLSKKVRRSHSDVT